MITLPKNATDLSAAWQRAKQRERDLHRMISDDLYRLDFRLRQVHRKELRQWQSAEKTKQIAFHANLLQWRRKQWRWVGMLWLISIAMWCFLCMGGNVLANLLADYYWQVMLYALFGMTCIAPITTIVILLVAQVSRPRPLPPDPPPQKPMLLPSCTIIPEWLIAIDQGLGKRSPEERTTGTPGEEYLIEVLRSRLPDNHFAIYNTRLKHNLDSDVIVLGPSGIWLLESKYWRGTISYYQGQWSRYQTQLHRGGLPYNEPIEIGYAPDEELKEEMYRVERYLKHHNPHIPWQKAIHGSVVFTYENSKIQIDSTCPVNWDIPQTASRRILLAPKKDFLTPDLLIEAADVLQKESERRSTDQPWRQSKPTLPVVERIYETRLKTIQGFHEKNIAR